tara:strand:+ start:3646 stop:3819 length:174 start_codon:yes stop_codon:yes gene_type:complete
MLQIFEMLVEISGECMISSNQIVDDKRQAFQYSFFAFYGVSILAVNKRHSCWGKIII